MRLDPARAGRSLPLRKVSPACGRSRATGKSKVAVQVLSSAGVSADALDVDKVREAGSDVATADNDERRLLAALRRYEVAYRSARPGTAGTVELARARIDLALLLDGETLPAPVAAQLARDGETLLRVTPELVGDQHGEPSPSDLAG